MWRIRSHGKHLLSQSPNCPSCNVVMTMQKRSDIQDKYRYVHIEVNRRRCPDMACRKSRSIRVFCSLKDGFSTVACPPVLVVSAVSSYRCSRRGKGVTTFGNSGVSRHFAVGDLLMLMHYSCLVDRVLWCK